MIERFERVEEKWHLTIEKSRIKSISFTRETGRAVRVIVDGRVGFASAVGAGFEELERKARLIAEFSGEKLENFPEKEKPGRVRIYDSKIESFDSAELKAMGETIIDSLKSGTISTGSVEVCRVRTEVDEISYEETLAFAFVEVVRDGSAYNYIQSRKIDLEGIENMVAEAEELARKPVESVSGSYRVTLSPIAVNQLLSYSLYPAFSAENVLKGRSPLRLGDDFGWQFKLIDDPTIDWGLNSCPFDDEGVTTSRKVLYDSGVGELLSDWRFSKLANMKPGNAFREETTSYPSIAPSNVVVDLEVGDPEMELYVHNLVGAHTANPVSGDFSVECGNAFLKDKPVKAMLYGNVYEVLKKAVCQSEPVQVDSTVCGAVFFEEGAFRVV